MPDPGLTVCTLIVRSQYKYNMTHAQISMEQDLKSITSLIQIIQNNVKRQSPLLSQGAYAPNDLLRSATRILEGHVNGPGKTLYHFGHGDHF